MKHSNLNRQELIAKLKNENFDVLVIGGGITGAGIILDAQARGMRTALVEMQDFAAGTSSRSTKLIHGGLRYLKQFEVKMVAEVGKERAIVYENGPHVTTPEWMMLPIHKGGTFGKLSTSFGLRIYDFLAGVKRAERRSMLSVEKTLEKEPLLKKTGLRGSGFYVEYRTDDARLTIEVIKEAMDRGAVAGNYLKVIELVYEDGKAAGVMVNDQLTKDTFKIRAKKLVNAAGPWVDTIRELDQSKKGKKLQLSKGVHLVLDQLRFPLNQAIYFDTPDGRMVFAIPREGKTYVGTTDTFYNKDVGNPRMAKEDCKYLIDAINYMFPTVKITEQDIESSWAGVRPLIYEEGKNPSEISRKDEIWESSSGLITIAGGKLTGYRKMAEMVLDLLVKKFLAEGVKGFSTCKTKSLPISGGKVGGSKNFNSFIDKQIGRGVELGLSKKAAEHITRIYGSNVKDVYDLLLNKKIEAQKSGLPLSLFAKLAYGIEFEMVATPIDFFNRRTGDILFNIREVEKWKIPVVQYMTDQFSWSDSERKAYLTALERELITAKTPVDETCCP